MHIKINILFQLNRSDVEYADWINSDENDLFVVLSNTKVTVLTNPPVSVIYINYKCTQTTILLTKINL